MSDHTEVPTVAGKVGPHRESHEPRLDATKFLVGVTPVQGFLEWNGTAGIGERWGMLGNDVFGDCGPAATSHNNMSKEQNPSIGGNLGRPKFNGVEGTYFAYGIAQGEPGPQPDEGVDNASWLGFLYKQGIIYGYGEVPLNSLDWFAQTARGAICGLTIDGTTAINDFNASPKIPWGPMPGASDGHDVLLIQTNANGTGGFVTWGAVIPFWEEFRVQITDAWIIYDADDPQIDHAALQGALADVHGVEVSQAAQTAHRGFWERIETDVEHILESV